MKTNKLENLVAALRFAGIAAASLFVLTCMFEKQIRAVSKSLLPTVSHVQVEGSVTYARSGVSAPMR